MVKSQLGELKEIAHDNIKKMEEREDNLEDLNDRAEKLDEAVRIYIYIMHVVKIKCHLTKLVIVLQRKRYPFNFNEK